MRQDNIFEILFEGNIVQVEEIHLHSQVLFRVIFKGKVPALVLCRSVNATLQKFWTSVPEGRQELASQVGILIEDHFRSK